MNQIIWNEKAVLAWVAILTSLTLCVILSYVLGNSEHQTGMYFDRTMAVLSAVGTNAAAIVALWLGLSADRTRAQQSRDHAALAAAGLVNQLSDCVAWALEAVNVVDQACPGKTYPDGPPDTSRLRDSVINKLSDPCFSIEKADIAALVPLPRQSANRINAALSELKRLRLDMESTKTDLPRWGRLHFEGRQHRFAGWHMALYVAYGHLKIAHAECQKIASLELSINHKGEVFAGDDKAY